jgi:subtilisin family serine protease
MRRTPLCISLALLVSAITLSLGLTSRVQPVAAQAGPSQDYVLTATQWDSKQNLAVLNAGGTIKFSSKKAGIAVVSSANPTFLSQALASGALNGGAADEVVQWQSPVHEVALNEQAITPGDETFITLQWNIQSIEAPAAWAAGYTGQGVRVAVIDGGIWDSHVDLAGQIDTARSTSFVTGFNFNQDVGTFWHGTHVAGIIAAKDNAIGTIGVAPNATIIGVKALHNGSGSFGAVISAILYASTPISDGGAGADIINMSLGAVFPKGAGPGTGQLISALNRAANYAGSNNVLVVSAAGNEGIDLDHSGSYTSVPAMSGSGIAVSATGPEGWAVGYPNGPTNFRNIAYYTNYGHSIVNVAAPGGNDSLPGTANCTLPLQPSGTITRQCWIFDLVLSTARGSGGSTTSYAFAEGTSMAAPAAAGVAALIKQRFPGISVGALKSKLASSADDEGAKGSDPFYGRGYINARRAVTE